MNPRTPANTPAYPNREAWDAVVFARLQEVGLHPRDFDASTLDEEFFALPQAPNRAATRLIEAWEED